MLRFAMLFCFVVVCSVVLFCSPGFSRQNDDDAGAAVPTLAVVYSEEFLATLYGSEFGRPIDAAEFANDGKTFMAISESYVGVYRTEDYRLLDKHSIPEQRFASIIGAGFIDAKTWYFVETVSGSIRDIEKGVEREKEETRAHVRSLFPVQEIASHPFEKSAKYVAAASGNHIAFSDELLDWKTGKIYRTKIAHHATPGLTVIHGHVVTHNDDVVVIDDPLHRETGVWDTGWSPIAQIAITPGIRRVITVSENGACQAWMPPPPDAQKVGSCGRGHLFAPVAYPRLAISPDGARLAVSVENQVRVYRIEPFDLELELETSMPTPVSALALSNDGRLAAGDENRLVRVWDIGNPQPIGAFSFAGFVSKRVSKEDTTIPKVTRLAFQPQGNQLAALMDSWMVILELPRHKR
jgi:hypothetical protein